MKKTSFFLAVIAMVAALVGVPIAVTRASSDNNFELVAESSREYLEAGDTVSVKVNLNRFESNYTFYTLGVKYDDNVLTYTNNTPGLAQHVEMNALDESVIDVVLSLNPSAAPALQTGTLATLNFEVKNGVSGGQTTISFLNAKFWDSEDNQYAATTSNATVNLANPITSISITNPDAKVGLGEDATVTVAIGPSDTTDSRGVTFTSSDESIATVDADGKIHGVSTGFVDITAASVARPSVKVTKRFEVTSALTGIKLDKTSLDIKKGDSEQITASPIPTTTTDDPSVTWSSSDETVATVDRAGVVTAVNYGTATVTATSNFDHSIKATATVKVTNHLESVAIDASEMTEIGSGLYQILSGAENAKTLSVNYTTAVAGDATTDTGTLVWTAEDDSILEVDNAGKVTGKKSGTTRVTVSFAGKSHAISVKVYVPVASVSLPDDFALDPRQERAISLNFNPTGADHGDVTWATTDTANEYIELIGDGRNGTIVVRAKDAPTTTPVTVTATVDGKSDSVKVSVNEIAIESVSIDKSEVTLKIVDGVGESEMLTAGILPANANGDKTITWRSSDDSVATVDANGKVTAVSAGTATITAESANGKTATSTVKVVIPLKSVAVNATEITLHKGETAELGYTLTPADTTETTPVEYSSRNEAVATIDNTGKITAVSVGDAVVTVSVAGKTADMTVHVDSPLAAISLREASVNMYKGTSKTFDVVFNPTDATDGREIIWESSDENIATVDENGKVTAKEAGTATIKATSSKAGITPATMTVNVRENKITGITIVDSVDTLKKGDSYLLGAELAKEDEMAETTDEINLEWESSDETVATVDADGRVVAKKAGTVVIKVKNGSLSDEVEITVEEIPLTGVMLGTSSRTLAIGEEMQITTTLIPVDTTDEVVFTWLSSNENVATVDENGKVTAIAAGTAVITMITDSGVKTQIEVTVVAKAPETGAMTGVAIGATSSVALSIIGASIAILLNTYRKTTKRSK